MIYETFFSRKKKVSNFQENRIEKPLLAKGFYASTYFLF